MKKNEIYLTLEKIDLTDVSRLEIDKVLGLLPDQVDVPADAVETVMDIIKLEMNLEDVNIQTFDDAIATVDKASADLNTLAQTTVTELEAKENQQAQQEAVIDDEMKYLEELANKANTTNVQPQQSLGQQPANMPQ